MKKMIKSVRPAYAHTKAHAVVLEVSSSKTFQLEFVFIKLQNSSEILIHLTFSNMRNYNSRTSNKPFQRTNLIYLSRNGRFEPAGPTAGLAQLHLRTRLS